MKIKAAIKINSADRGGKPVTNFWKPTLATELRQSGCKLLLLGSAKLCPGDSGEAEIVLTSREAPKLKVGSTFMLNEGFSVVAEGKVLRVVN